MFDENKTGTSLSGACCTCVTLGTLVPRVILTLVKIFTRVKMTWCWRWSVVAIVFAAVASLHAGEGALPEPLHGDEIRVELVQPPAKFYVIGDAIPIEWRFTNTTDEPIGMFWEGCCFTYGEIAAEGPGGERPQRKRPPMPPNAPANWTPDPKTAQAWHAFPQVTRIEPHKGESFQTVLDNWIEVSKSGHYKLTASYTGAPESALQRHEKIKLWNGKSVAKAVEMEVLTPDEYLAQKAVQRESSIQLSAITAKPVLKPTTSPMPVSFKIRNESKEPVEAKCELWVLDENQKRIIPDAVIPGLTRFSAESVTISAGAESAVSWNIGMADVLNLSLNKKYTIFADCSWSGARCPTEIVDFEWRIEPEDALYLVREASKASGKAGERAVPLRIIHRYLIEIAKLLKDPRAMEKMERNDFTPYVLFIADLEQAAALKSASHGNNFLTMTISIVDGHLSLSPALADKPLFIPDPTPRLPDDLAGKAFRATSPSMLVADPTPKDVRNYLESLNPALNLANLTIKIEIAPDNNTTMEVLRAFGHAMDFLQYPSIPVVLGSGEAMRRVSLQFAPLANVLLSFGAHNEVVFSVKKDQDSFTALDVKEFQEGRNTRNTKETIAQFRDAVSKLSRPQVRIVANDNTLISDIDITALEGLGEVTIATEGP